VGTPIAKANDADAAETVDVVEFPVGVTVKVYEVPVTNPETEQDCEPVRAEELATLQVRPLGVETTL
jgi:hypothetical protein